MTHAGGWPPHFFLIGTSSMHTARQKPSVHNMGSKAHHLLKMAELGLPVPPALVIGTHHTRHPQACLMPLNAVGMPALEQLTGMGFGDVRNPLIVSVRSGAPVSMPGMMETLLNIGLCEQTLPGLLRQTGNPRLVWDAYRRLIATYGEVVAGVPGHLFEQALTESTQGRDERELDFSELRTLSRSFLALYQQSTGEPFPQNVTDQLNGAVQAVFDSWSQPKARTYRELNGIDHDLGTAVTIQRMVFGNAGSHAGAGVGFTRDPIDGSPALWVDFLANAQGEDVVAGQRNAHGHASLQTTAPAAWSELQNTARTLETAFADMQDFEFTVQDGRLFMLQTRAGKRTPLAATRIALDLLDEGVIDARTALDRLRHIQAADLTTRQLAQAGHATSSAAQPLAQASVACSGVAQGEIALDETQARLRQADGVAVVLVRQDAQTSDIAALDAATGLITQRGARTSHAAVVARQLGKVCLVGCSQLRIDMDRRTTFWGDTEMPEGTVITLDGSTGQVYAGQVETVEVEDSALLARLMALRESA